MIRTIWFLLVVLALTFSSGCSHNEPSMKTSQENMKQEEIGASNSEEQGSEVQVRQPKVNEKSVSPDGKYTAYIVTHNGRNHLFLGQGTDFKNAKEVNGNTEYGNAIQWSPNSKFFFVRHSDPGSGSILSSENRIDFPIRFETGPFWSPDGNKICFSQYSEVWSAQKKFSVISYDVVVKDLTTSEFLAPQVFAKGTEDFYYKVLDWDKNGEIEYERLAHKDDQLLASLSMEYSHYLWTVDSESGKSQALRRITDLGYQYFDVSPDKKWLSMVKIMVSAGEAEGGIPAFYNLETGELRDFGKEYNTWFWNPQWFKDSSKMMLNETSIYDMATDRLTELNLPKEKRWLGAKPSPDGTKFVALGYTEMENSLSKGRQLTVYLLTMKGQLLKTIQTPLYPNYSDNLLMPIPVKFDWLKDNQNLVIEAWNQDRVETTLQKLNLNTGDLSVLAKSTDNPTVAPDGKKIAVFSSDRPDQSAAYNQLKVLDTEGKTLSAFDIQGGNQILWDDNSEQVLVSRNGENYKYKVLTLFTLGSGEKKEFKVVRDMNPLYIENENVICIGGPSS